LPGCGFNTSTARLHEQGVIELLKFYKDKNLKAYQDCKKVKEELQSVKLHMAYERKLKERLATGPVYDFKVMLLELLELTSQARERLQWYIVQSNSAIPPFTDFSSYCYFLKAGIFMLYDLPYSTEPITAEDLEEIFSSMQGNLLHQSTLVYTLCTGEIQCLNPEVILCELGNVAVFVLQLVYAFLEQAPDVAPKVNRRVVSLDFVLQPYVPGLARNVQQTWKDAEAEHKDFLVKNSQMLLKYCSSRKQHFSKLHQIYMDLSLDLLYLLQSLAGTLDDFLQREKPKAFNAQLQKMCLPMFPPSSRTAQYLPQMRDCDSAVASAWSLPAALIYAIFPVEASEKGKQAESFEQ
jgi:hypothetical protein